MLRVQFPSYYHLILKVFYPYSPLVSPEPQRAVGNRLFFLVPRHRFGCGRCFPLLVYFRARLIVASVSDLPTLGTFTRLPSAVYWFKKSKLR